MGTRLRDGVRWREEDPSLAACSITPDRVVAYTGNEASRDEFYAMCLQLVD